jgi:hypothetical protein
VPVTGSQLAVMPIDVREGAKAIVFDFVDPLGMIEGFGQADERHRAEWLGAMPLTLTAEQCRCQAHPFCSQR